MKFLTFLFVMALSHSVSAIVVCDPLPQQILKYKTDTYLPKSNTLLLLTHASSEFHNKPQTILGIQSAVEFFTGRADIVYIHTGKLKNALYPHCQPNAFYMSSSGNIHLSLEGVDRLVMLGGNFLYCLNDTWIGVSKAIQSLSQPKSFEIDFVIDGIYDLTQGLSTLFGGDTVERLIRTPGIGLSFNYLDMAAVLDNSAMSQIFSYYFERRPIPDFYTVTGHFRGLQFPIQKGKGFYKIDVYFLASKELN